MQLNVAALPLGRLILQILDEFVPCFPVSSTVSCQESVSQMLLRPGHIVLHLRISGILLQLLDLRCDIGSILGVKVDGQTETAG